MRASRFFPRKAQDAHILRRAGGEWGCVAMTVSFEKRGEDMREGLQSFCRWCLPGV